VAVGPPLDLSNPQRTATTWVLGEGARWGGGGEEQGGHRAAGK
jgi:hypothetical protein